MSNGNTTRRLPKNFKLSEYLSDEQKEKIINAIKRNIPIIITGVQGKTGKDYLNSFGVIAYELWECETVELNVFI